MDALGLVVLDDRIFLTKVVKRGLEQGIFTRDRADEIIRISVAMANKYVLQKEVDFRSSEELSEVQETILKLVGVGLEIRAGGDVNDGVGLLMEDSPVDLFRLAYTRVSKLRHAWRLLLQDHRVEILVSTEEYQCLDELSCQRLSQMSVFSEAEVGEIESNTLSDKMFSTLAVLEYYEAELERYRFILRLRGILPFDLLNKSRAVRAENLSEVDSLRDALIHTLIISQFVGTPDPVAVSMPDVRTFLEFLESTEFSGEIPDKIESVLVDLVHELGEGLEKSDVTLLTGEIVRVAEKFLATILGEWDMINSSVEATFFKRWCRLAILADAPDPVAQILSSDQMIDEFEFETLMDRMTNRSESEIIEFARGLPWSRLNPEQVIRFFHELGDYQEALASTCLLTGFSPAEFVDLLEVVSGDALGSLMPAVENAMADLRFSMEDLEVMAALPHKEIPALLRKAGPPVDYEPDRIIGGFGDAGDLGRRVFFHTSWDRDYFPELVHDACSVSPEFVKRFLKSLPPAEAGAFFESAAGKDRPRVVRSRDKEKRLRFKSKDLQAMYESLSATKKKAAVGHFETKA